MAQYYPGVMQTSPYSYLSHGPNPASQMSQATTYPPIQMNNLYSRPQAVSLDRNNGYNDYSAHQMVYHHIYGASPYFHPHPYWQFPQASPLPLYNPYANYYPHAAYQQPRWDVWPEGFTLRGELHWGRLERVAGPRRDLPEFVREDLRRVYGTYPRTDVSITYYNGEYLVRGDPIVGEQEYRIEKRIIRKEPTPTVSETEESSEDKKKKKKKKSNK